MVLAVSLSQSPVQPSWWNGRAWVSFAISDESVSQTTVLQEHTTNPFDVLKQIDMSPRHDARGPRIALHFAFAISLLRRGLFG